VNGDLKAPKYGGKVVELLDDLREVIWNKYQLQLYELIHAGHTGIRKH
jgi:hypothetical protein